jgi:hypothetical protein
MRPDTSHPDNQGIAMMTIENLVWGVVAILEASASPCQPSAELLASPTPEGHHKEARLRRRERPQDVLRVS